MNKKGILVVLSGFSGSGKGTIMRELMDRYSDQYALSISVTTRKPRFCEQDGRDYFFKNRTEYQELTKNPLKPKVFANDNGIDEDLPEENE